MTPRLAIIVGHSEESPGSLSALAIGMTEYAWNHEFALDLYREARTIGLEAKVFTRNGISIQKVGELVTEWCGKDGVAIELHCNSFDKKTAGTETLYDDEPVNSREFAEFMHKKIMAVFGIHQRSNRGIKLRTLKDSDKTNDRGAHNLQHVKVTSCLLEPVFWDNPIEAMLLKERRGDYMRVLVSGISHWYLKNA